VPSGQQSADSHDGTTEGKIAFSAGGDIYVMNSDGSDLRPITHDGRAVDERQPAISPDGTLIAFSSNRDGNYNIFVADLDGSNIRPLAKSEDFNVDPAWSPDGRKIAFVRGEDLTEGGVAYMTTCPPEIFVMNVDGSGEVRLTTGGGADPAWSPDGTHIAFSSHRTGNYEIYSMSADGGDLHQLTNTNKTSADPVWSPDGRFIAYGSDYTIAREDCGFMHTGTPGGGDDPELVADGSESNIYVMSSDGSGQKRLTDGKSGNNPVWSPDGTQLIFVSRRDGYSQIYRMAADGTDRTMLTQDATQKSSPTWSGVRFR
jgi:Tol biopolymer transport system component